MKANRLKHLYVEQLKDLYSAESPMGKHFQRWPRQLLYKNCGRALKSTWMQTEGHIVRLEEIFKALGESPKGKKCKGIGGLIKECAAMIDEDPAPEELDAWLTSAAQRVEH
jgi:ferritin-like metal-binding protein YciE